MNERANPVKLNGKAYRGKIEVFVNARGSLDVVNVVPLEEYLLGVVPAELGLPHIEAQKAQAITASGHMRWRILTATARRVLTWCRRFS